MMQKIKCFLGFHKYELLGRSDYRYAIDSWNQRVLKSLVYKCKCCNKPDVPKWYKSSYRTLNPYCDIHGFPSKWHPEFSELLQP
jgi:hypothetical protein